MCDSVTVCVCVCVCVRTKNLRMILVPTDIFSVSFKVYILYLTQSKEEK